MLRRLLNPKTLVGGAMGFAAAYFLDKDNGRTRRARARGRMGARARRMQHDAGRRARYSEGRVRGVLHGRGARTHAEDHELRDRVQSQVLADPRWKGRVNIEALGTTVTLRGQLDDDDAIRALEDRVRHVDGVHVVESYLHTPGTPAPNKARVLQLAAGTTGGTRSFG